MAKANLVIFILIPLLLSPLFVVSQEQTTQATSNDDWPMFRHDPAHSGAPNSAGPPTPIQLWNYSEGHFDGFFLGSSPAVVNGIVYIGSNQLSYEKGGGNIYALDASTGVKIWNYSTSISGYDAIYSSPAVVENKVFIGAGRFVLALDALNGKKIWGFETGGQVDSSPCVVDGRVFVGSNDGNIYAISASTGLKIWAYPTGDGVVSSPAVVDNVVYIGSCDGNLYALDAATGKEVWVYAISGQVESSPVISNGVLYIGSSYGYLFAFNASNGKVIWSFETKHRNIDGITVTPVVANGKVYVCTNVALQAVDVTTGTEIWRNESFAFYSSPIVADGVLYISSYAFNASTGTEIWHFQTGNQINSSPAIVNDVMYISSQDGHLYAIGEQLTAPSPTSTVLLVLNSGEILLVTLGVLTVVIVATTSIVIHRRKKPKLM